MDAIGFKFEAPAVTEPWRKVLLDAADYIETHGWCQDYARSGQSVCLMGAIASVSDGVFCGRGDQNIRQHSKIGDEAAEKMFAANKGSGWNDAPGRTAAEVCAALRACAAS